MSFSEKNQSDKDYVSPRDENNCDNDTTNHASNYFSCNTNNISDDSESEYYSTEPQTENEQFSSTYDSKKSKNSGLYDSDMDYNSAESQSEFESSETECDSAEFSFHSAEELTEYEIIPSNSCYEIASLHPSPSGMECGDAFSKVCCDDLFMQANTGFEVVFGDIWVSWATNGLFNVVAKVMMGTWEEDNQFSYSMYEFYENGFFAEEFVAQIIHYRIAIFITPFSYSEYVYTEYYPDDDIYMTSVGNSISVSIKRRIGTTQSNPRICSSMSDMSKFEYSSYVNLDCDAHATNDIAFEVLGNFQNSTLCTDVVMEEVDVEETTLSDIHIQTVSDIDAETHDNARTDFIDLESGGNVEPTAMTEVTDATKSCVRLASYVNLSTNVKFTEDNASNNDNILYDSEIQNGIEFPEEIEVVPSVKFNITNYQPHKELEERIVLQSIEKLEPRHSHTCIENTDMFNDFGKQNVPELIENLAINHRDKYRVDPSIHKEFADKIAFETGRNLEMKPSVSKYYIDPSIPKEFVDQIAFEPDRNLEMKPPSVNKYYIDPYIPKKFADQIAFEPDRNLEMKPPSVSKYYIDPSIPKEFADQIAFEPDRNLDTKPSSVNKYHIDKQGVPKEFADQIALEAGRNLEMKPPDDCSFHNKHIRLEKTSTDVYSVNGNHTSDECEGQNVLKAYGRLDPTVTDNNNFDQNDLSNKCKNQDILISKPQTAPNTPRPFVKSKAIWPQKCLYIYKDDNELGNENFEKVENKKFMHEQNCWEEVNNIQYNKNDVRLNSQSFKDQDISSNFERMEMCSERACPVNSYQFNKMNRYVNSVDPTNFQYQAYPITTETHYKDCKSAVSNCTKLHDRSKVPEEQSDLPYEEKPYWHSPRYNYKSISQCQLYSADSETMYILPGIYDPSIEKEDLPLLYPHYDEIENAYADQTFTAAENDYYYSQNDKVTAHNRFTDRNNEQYLQPSPQRNNRLQNENFTRNLNDTKSICTIYRRKEEEHNDYDTQVLPTVQQTDCIDENKNNECYSKPGTGHANNVHSTACVERQASHKSYAASLEQREYSQKHISATLPSDQRTACKNLSQPSFSTEKRCPKSYKSYKSINNNSPPMDKHPNYGQCPVNVQSKSHACGYNKSDIFPSSEKLKCATNHTSSILPSYKQIECVYEEQDLNVQQKMSFVKQSESKCEDNVAQNSLFKVLSDSRHLQNDSFSATSSLEEDTDSECEQSSESNHKKKRQAKKRTRYNKKFSKRMKAKFDKNKHMDQQSTSGMESPISDLLRNLNLSECDDSKDESNEKNLKNKEYYNQYREESCSKLVSGMPCVNPSFARIITPWINKSNQVRTNIEHSDKKALKSKQEKRKSNKPPPKNKEKKPKMSPQLIICTVNECREKLTDNMFLSHCIEDHIWENRKFLKEVFLDEESHFKLNMSKMCFGAQKTIRILLYGGRAGEENTLPGKRSCSIPNLGLKDQYCCFKYHLPIVLTVAVTSRNKLLSELCFVGARGPIYVTDQLVAIWLASAPTAIPLRYTLTIYDKYDAVRYEKFLAVQSIVEGFDVNRHIQRVSSIDRQEFNKLIGKSNGVKIGITIHEQIHE
ncbi:uncharacterized protein LOC119687029 isoform X2 [Teleopsis dalmanni]|uniref:uncharacterized protein LOC119687029 isoform X2 n=1 Tax=Teleopsis dalmanni TaxID=139649 RepID=UPI0018CCFA32|nr:uncharacterized protein LOC119687029 isoform X2 [Teleopsis dalmanni]